MTSQTVEEHIIPSGCLEVALCQFSSFIYLFKWFVLRHMFCFPCIGEKQSSLFVSAGHMNKKKTAQVSRSLIILCHEPIEIIIKKKKKNVCKISGKYSL